MNPAIVPEWWNGIRIMRCFISLKETADLASFFIHFGVKRLFFEFVQESRAEIIIWTNIGTWQK